MEQLSEQLLSYRFIAAFVALLEPCREKSLTKANTFENLLQGQVPIIRACIAKSPRGRPPRHMHPICHDSDKQHSDA